MIFHVFSLTLHCKTSIRVDKVNETILVLVMKRFVFFSLFYALWLNAGQVSAKPACSEPYTVSAGDTLSKIARAAYQDSNLWPYIYGYSNNAAVIGADPGLISIGISLKLPPCPQTGQTAAVEPIVNDREARTPDTIEALTGGDYAPFTDQNLEKGGMLTEIVDAAFGQADGRPDYSIDWINDWSAHIDPLLRRHKYAMGFPWFKPNCDAPETLSDDDVKRCEFDFSEPLFDMLIILFKRSDDNRTLASDQDLHGARLCRPAGYFTFDLTARGLVPGETIELERPQSVGDCFHKLVDGDVDFVTINEFTGDSAIKEFGYGDVVNASEQLADTLGLHLIIHRDHPNAGAYLRQFNSGLTALRANGRYDEIVGRHLANFHGQGS
jgi:polar amino acid transport system substrate-binding protein